MIFMDKLFFTAMVCIVHDLWVGNFPPLLKKPANVAVLLSFAHAPFT
jgi:hypothetical protein